MSQRTLILALVAVALVVAGAAVWWLLRDDGGAGSSDDDDGYPTALEPAPIESVTLSVAESFPPQYFLAVVSGLPDGCAQFEGYDVERKENNVIVTVTNRVPAPGSDVVCAQVYRTMETNIALGSEFTSGETYQVVVNGDQWEEFVAQ